MSLRLVCFGLLLGSMATLVASETVASSSITTGMDPYVANDVATGLYLGAHDVSTDSASLATYAGNTLKLVDLATEAVTDLGNPTDYDLPEDVDGPWNSFVTYDPAGDSVWVGFTVGGNVDDRIYQVDLASSTWTHQATMPGNFDLEFAGATPLVSGTNSTNWADPTGIWQLDTSGADVHDLLIETSGYSAGLGVDSQGNVYYAANDAAGIYQWAAADVLAAIGTGNMTYANGLKISEQEAGAYDIEVDAADHVFFNGNGAYAFTALWDGTSEAGEYNYDYVAIGSGDFGNWHTLLSASGDVASGDGALYQSDWYYFGAAEITLVPEPAAWVLLTTLLGVGLATWRR